MSFKRPRTAGQNVHQRKFFVGHLISKSSLSTKGQGKFVINQAINQTDQPKKIIYTLWYGDLITSIRQDILQFKDWEDFKVLRIYLWEYKIQLQKFLHRSFRCSCIIVVIIVKFFRGQKFTVVVEVLAFVRSLVDSEKNRGWEGLIALITCQLIFVVISRAFEGWFKPGKKVFLNLTHDFDPVPDRFPDSRHFNLHIQNALINTVDVIIKANVRAGMDLEHLLRPVGFTTFVAFEFVWLIFFLRAVMVLDHHFWQEFLLLSVWQNKLRREMFFQN